MKKYIRVIFYFAIILFSSQVNAYDSKWTNFDASSLDDARDQTMGETQRLLEQRGTVECIACHGETNDQYDGVLNTLEIVEGTMGAALSCLDWEAKGICVWATCVAFVCTFDISVKVENFVPELVIQAYDRANGEPWTESQDINQVSQGTTDSSWVTSLISLVEDFDVDNVGIRGGQPSQTTRVQHQNLSFKLVDAYGNPAITAFNLLGTSLFGLMCPGTTVMFFPYFISNLDAIAWRWDIPEMFYPQSWAGFFIYDLGSSTNNYGAIYPRHGFQTSQDPLKAAVLVAYRAAHFITDKGEPHLYFTIAKSDSDGYWTPGRLDQSDSRTGEWQMLYPKMDSSCKRFPYGGNPSSSRRSDDGSYIWNFWRKYKCCQKKGSTLIFHNG